MEVYFKMFNKNKSLSEEQIKELTEKISKDIMSKQEENRKSMSADQIKELSDQIAKDVMVKQSENMMERVKEFSSEDGKIDTVGRMAFVIKECNRFTADYVVQMLTKMFE